MCGIGGVYHLKHKPIAVDTLLSMGQVIRHRGPDDEGYLLVETRSNTCKHVYGPDTVATLKGTLAPPVNDIQANLGFAFRRLSILDLSERGHQPMSDESGRVWIVFNGEVYNYLEIREELVALGYHFYSNADTEVVLKAYLAWGADCLQRFVGMWAFAIWDGNERRLFCARDRFGVKPLYYAFDGQTLLFGSEVKQLLLHPIDKAFREEVIYKSLILPAYLINSDNSYYEQVHILPHGHYLVADEKGIQIQRYYDLDHTRFSTYTGSFEEAVAEYQSLFFQAVQQHMRSDVEVGITLSGGLDSTAILAAAHGTTPKTIQTFTSYFTDAPVYDEREWIQQVIDRYQVTPHYMSAKPQDTMDTLTQMTWIHDYPILSSSVVASYFLMKKIREHGVVVVLSGQGSDEMAAGYNHNFYRYYAQLLRKGDLRRFAAEYPAYFRHIPQGGSLSKLARLVAVFLLPESALYKLEAQFNQQNPLSVRFNNFEIFDNIRDLPTDKLSNFLYNQMMSTSIQTLLHFEDRNSMASSIESRVPFLDHRLVEFVFSLPPSFKMHQYYRKRIHREAMKPFIPTGVLERKDKNGYLAPGESHWLRAEMRPYLEEIIHSREFRERGIFRHTFVEKAYRAFLQGDNSHAQMLWNSMALEIFFRSQAAGERVSGL